MFSLLFEFSLSTGGNNQGGRQRKETHSRSPVLGAPCSTEKKRRRQTMARAWTATKYEAAFVRSSESAQLKRSMPCCCCRQCTRAPPE